MCAVKRGALPARAVLLAKEVGSFPSTSNVAATMFKKRLLETGKTQAELEAHFRALRAIHIPDDKIEKDCLPELAKIATSLSEDVQEGLLRFDGDLFYTETFTVNPGQTH